MNSVREWSVSRGSDYRFIGDEIFDLVDPLLVKKTVEQRVIATDIARLIAMKKALSEGYDRVIWFDADFLIFAPDEFVLPSISEFTQGYMVGREVWVQQEVDRPPKLKTKLKAKVKVHNAFLLFDRGNSFLDFYLDHAQRLLGRCDGPIPPQFVGPKLLTAIHNVVQCPVQESAGMLSPEVLKDLLSDGKRICALQLMRKRSRAPIAGANLCSSLISNDLQSDFMLSSSDMNELIDRLVNNGVCI